MLMIREIAAKGVRVTANAAEPREFGIADLATPRGYWRQPTLPWRWQRFVGPTAGAQPSVEAQSQAHPGRPLPDRRH